MLRTYITTIPLQGRSDLKPVRYEAPQLRDVIFTRYPIIQCIHETLLPGDEALVLAIRQENADTARNYALFLEELQGQGIGADRVQLISLPENQSSSNLTLLLRRLADAIPQVTRVYACITYGTKSIPIVTMTALSCAERTHTEVEIGGICYGEMQRVDGEQQKTNYCDMTSLFRLSSLVSHMDTTESADALFRHLLWLNDRYGGAE